VRFRRHDCVVAVVVMMMIILPFFGAVFLSPCLGGLWRPVRLSHWYRES
jgi:hypothetical protein